MKISVNSQDLSSRLSAVAKVIQQKSPMPVLTSMFMYATAENIYLMGGNNEGITVSTSVPVMNCDVPGTVKTCIDHKMLINAVGKLPKQVITIDIEEKNDVASMVVTHGSGCFSMISSYKGDEYPMPKSVTPLHSVTISGENFAKGITSALTSVVDDGLRPQMNCVYVHHKDDALTFVGLCKLGGMVSSVKVQQQEEFGVLIPANAAASLKTLINKNSGVRIEDCGNHIRVTCSIGTELMSSLTVTAQLFEGKYAQYWRVFPKVVNTTITFDRGTLLNAIDRVSTFAGVNSMLIITTTEGNDSVHIEGRDVMLSNEAFEDVKCSWQGNSIRLCVSGERLVSLIKEMVADEIQILVSDVCKPIVISPVDEKEINIKSLIAPMMYAE